MFWGCRWSRASLNCIDHRLILPQRVIAPSCLHDKFLLHLPVYCCQSTIFLAVSFSFPHKKDLFFCYFYVTASLYITMRHSHFWRNANIKTICWVDDRLNHMILVISSASEAMKRHKWWKDAAVGVHNWSFFFWNIFNIIKASCWINVRNFSKLSASFIVNHKTNITIVSTSSTPFFKHSKSLDKTL